MNFWSKKLCCFSKLQANSSRQGKWLWELTSSIESLLVTHHGIHQHRIIEKSSRAMPINSSKLIHLIVLQLEFPFKRTFPFPFPFYLWDRAECVFIMCFVYLYIGYFKLKRGCNPMDFKIEYF